jgi:hypothetical protein
VTPGGNSRDPEARARSLANLQRGGGRPASSEHRPALKHGAYCRVSDDERYAEIAGMRDALGEDAPLLDAFDASVLWDWAATRVQIAKAQADIEDHGWKDRTTGEARQLVRDLERWRARALEYAKEFGATPRARGALGLDLARVRALGPDPVLGMSGLDGGDDAEGG